MSSLLTSILKFTIGILFKKLRDNVAKHLFGDPTDESFRQFISRELNEIKSKLDALLRKDLLSSIEFLEDGICHLRMSVSSKGNEASTEECKAFSLASLGWATTTGMYEITSEERYERAQESFKIAGQEATRAFSNPASKIQDRILATKLRITARILEGNKDLESAVNAAIMYLESLHELPAIQEAFSVYLDGSLKSLFNKTERLYIVQNVTMINLLLFDFTRRFTRLPQDLFSWPIIKLEQLIYQPVLRDPSISLGQFAVEEEGPFQFQFGKGIQICNVGSAVVNSRGNIVAETTEGTLSVINTITDKTKTLHSFDNQDSGVLKSRIDSVAIDNDDNVYVITCFKGSLNVISFNYKLWIFNSCGELKHECMLDFLSARHIVGIIVQIMVNNKMMVLKKAQDEQLYICDSKGKLKSSFTLLEKFGQVFLSHSDAAGEEILIGYAQTVCVYNHKGNLTKTIQLPKGQRMYGLAFNQITKKIIVLTKTSSCMQLLSYGKTNNMEQKLSLGFDIWSCNLKSHPTSGLVALIDKTGGLFI